MAPFLHIPGDDHTGNEKCQQPETQETWKTNESLRGSLSLLEYMECSPAVLPRPSEQVRPSPTNLIKRQSARNQKCLKEQAKTGSRMVSTQAAGDAVLPQQGGRYRLFVTQKQSQLLQ